MAGMDWFRWHHGTVTDPKFGLVARKAGVSVAEVIAVWAVILEEASMAEARGSLGHLDFESIDYALGLSDGKAQLIFERMADRGLVDPDAGVVSKWNKRQPKREDETANERKRRQRERDAEAKKACDINEDGVTNSNVTQCHARGEESRQEVNLKTFSLASVNDTPSPPTPAGVVCARLKRAGVTQVNPSNPNLLALLAQGVTADEFADLADEPGSKGKGFNWLLATVKYRREDAAKLGNLPPARASPRHALAAERERISRAMNGNHGGPEHDERDTERDTERDITGEVERLA